MKTSFVAALAGVALACGWAGGAQAQSFDDFMAVCEATGVDGDAIRAKAAGLGWTPVPDSAVKAFRSDDPEMPFIAEFAMTAPGDAVGILIFATAEAPLGGGTVDADACILATDSVDAKEALRRLEALKYGTLVEDEAEAGAYMVYSRGPDGVRDEDALAEASDEEIRAAARRRPLFMLGAIGEPTMLLMALRVRAD